MASWKDTIQDDPALAGDSEDGAILETLKDFGRGAAQGATFSFADELVGAGEAGLDVLKDPEKLNQFLELYQQHRDESRQNFKEAEERSPYASFAGNMAGGLALPGLGAVKALDKGASLGKIALQGAKMGALGGAAYGAGASEADVVSGEKEQLMKLLGDTATSTAVGGVAGGVLASAVPGIKALGSKLKEKDLVPEIAENFVEAFKREKAGEKLVGKQARRNLEKKVQSEAEELMASLSDETGRGRDLKKAAIQAADDSGIKLNIKDIFAKYEQEAMKLPERRLDQKKEKEEILRLIRNELYGPEVSKEVVTAPGRVIPGETLPSGEESAINALKKRIASMNVRKEMDEPGKVAEAKLRDKFAQRELSGSGDDVTVPFSDIAEDMSSAGPKGLTTTGPQGEPMAQVIRDIKPGEIKIVNDPVTGQKVAAFMDEASGKVITQPVTDDVARSTVKILPKETRTVTERTGGKTEFIPSELQQLLSDVRDLTKLGETPIKSKEASKVIGDMTKDLRDTMRSDAMGKFATDIQGGDKIVRAALDAEEILFPALKGLSESDKSKIQKSISGTIRKLEQEGEGGVGARQIVRDALDRMADTNPELAKRLETKLMDTATSYDLARQIGAESAIQGSLVGTVQAKVIGAAGLAGRAARTMKSFISGSTPTTLRTMREGLEGQKVPGDLINKLQAAEEAGSNNYLRNSILFGIMQNPEYRSILGITEKNEDN